MKKYNILLAICIVVLIAGCGGGGDNSTGVIPNNVSLPTAAPTATPGTLVEVPGNPAATPGSTIPSSVPTGTFKVEVQFPGGNFGLRAKELAGSDLPYNSHTLRVTITGEAITGTISGERTDLDPTGAGTYTLTVSNIPVGLNTATIEVLDGSNNLLCQRKHGFYMTPGATEGPGLILLGVAIQGDGSYVPQNIDIPAGSTLIFQNQDYNNDRTASMNTGSITVGPIGHATHITQPVISEVFPVLNHIFNTSGQFNYDGQSGRVLVYGLPTLASITPDKDSNNGSSSVSFTLTGTNFGTTRAGVDGKVRFIQVEENDPNNPWGTSYYVSDFTTWTDTSIQGSINLAGGKYRVEVSVRGENTAENIFFYKGSGSYLVTVGSPQMVLITGTGTGANDIAFKMQTTTDVKISNFYMGTYEVTNAEYRLFNSGKPDDSKPVVNVSRSDVINYCNWLSSKMGLEACYSGDNVDITKNGYRLPTEAEWEYACRAGSTGMYYWGEAMDGNYCWYTSNSGNQTHNVGTAGVSGYPNNFGLYDMSGNVWEWCNDWFGSFPYGFPPYNDPVGPLSGSERVIRGGSCVDVAWNCESAFRGSFPPSLNTTNVGFRLVRTDTNSYSAPLISGFSISSGAVNSTVTINGSNFSSTNRNNIVKFNGVYAKTEVASSTQLTVKVPAGATTGKISVRTPGGTAYSAANFVVTLTTPHIGEMVLLSKGTCTLSQFSPTSVTFTNDFYVGRYEITNAQYRLWPDAGSHNGDTTELNNSNYDNYPVRNVSWTDVVQYCNWLSSQESLTSCYSWTDPNDPNTYSITISNNGYRLPTEAEWEYACRGGTTTEYYWGDTMDPLKCWFSYNYPPPPTMPHSVGYGGGHPWGLYDMSGNVWEWCSNWWETNPSGGTDPVGPVTPGTLRVLRGGCWGNGDVICRSAMRDSEAPYNRYGAHGGGLGFRIVKTK